MNKPRVRVTNRPMKKMIIFAILVLLIAGAGAWAIFYSPWSSEIRKLTAGKGRVSGPARESTAVLPGHIYRMESFIVNLNDENGMRYLKIKIEIESNQEKENQEYEMRLPQLRDATLAILSGKNHKEIMSAEGKKILKEELRERFNKLLKDFRVQKIYFTEFIIQ